MDMSALSSMFWPFVRPSSARALHPLMILITYLYSKNVCIDCFLEQPVALTVFFSTLQVGQNSMRSWDGHQAGFIENLPWGSFQKDVKSPGFWSTCLPVFCGDKCRGYIVGLSPRQSSPQVCVLLHYKIPQAVSVPQKILLCFRKVSGNFLKFKKIYIFTKGNTFSTSGM